MFRKFVSAFLFVSVFSIISCSGNKDNDTAMSMEQLHAANGQPVSVRELTPEDFSIFLKYPTIITAASESTASAAINDVVRTVSVSVGDRVSQDQVIISFSANNTTLTQATLAHDNALATLNRMRPLFNNRDISQHEFDQVRMAYEIARTNLRAANDMVYVKAPISGTITQINVRPTENVRPGMPLFTVSNQSGFEARFYVGIEEIERIQVGARTFISHDKRERTLEGRIVQVSQMMDIQKQSFPVTAYFDGRNQRLVSGLSVDISVETYRNENAMVLLRRELIESETGFSAFIAEGDSVRKVNVVTGAIKDMHIEVLNGGLKLGDIIVSEGVQHINESSKINIVPAILR